MYSIADWFAAMDVMERLFMAFLGLIGMSALMAGVGIPGSIIAGLAIVGMISFIVLTVFESWILTFIVLLIGIVVFIRLQTGKSAEV